MEGEIWGGRNTFKKTIGIVKKQAAHDGWLALKFGIFDVPAAAGGVEARRCYPVGSGTGAVETAFSG